jgi:hypothetical protein
MTNEEMADGEFFHPDGMIKAKQCLLTTVKYDPFAIRHFQIRHFLVLQ